MRVDAIVVTVLEGLKKDVSKALDMLENSTLTNPFVTVAMAHHLFRNLYPNDPYIQNNNHLGHAERISKAVNEVIKILTVSQELGSYPLVPIQSQETQEDVKELTGLVYKDLWLSFDKVFIVDQAKEILQSRFSANSFSLADLAKGDVLDAGCGSGRFTLALSEFAQTIVGVDYGVDGMSFGKSFIDGTPSHSRIDFVKGDLLNLPFESCRFDFVFSNGTAHHTQNPTRAIQELFRVTRSGGNIFLYVYGDGGIFWSARKRMNKFMKAIPQDFSRRVLMSMGMPTNRFIFEDNWYVPIENHINKRDLESLLVSLGARKIVRFKHGTPTDLPHFTNEDYEIYGDGELRYLVHL